ncbi:hypothetical protein ACWDUL_25790 [Nocardia niigatensis]
MAYTRNEGFMNGPGQAPGNTVPGVGKVGRVSGFLLIAAAVLTVAMFWLPVTTLRFHGSSWDRYVWRSAMRGGGLRTSDYLSAVPYVLMVIVAGVAGTLLAVGMGARRGVLFWVAAFAGGLVLQIASGDVVGYARGFGEDSSPGPGFWVITLVTLVALAALVTGLRDAVVSKRGAAQEMGGAPSGGVADRVTGVFLVVAAAVGFGSSFVPLVGDRSIFLSMWRTGEGGSVPLFAVHFTVGSIAVAVVAIALLAGAGLRNPAVRAAGGAAAAVIVANATGGLSLVFAVLGFNFWEYAGVGFWLTVLTLVLSFAAAVAGLVAQLSRPRLPAHPRVGYAPGFMPPGSIPAGPVGAMNPYAVAPGANPFAPGGQPGAAAGNPFASSASPSNPFASSASPSNPFAQPTAAPNPCAPEGIAPNRVAATAPDVEATVKRSPESSSVQPPRMAKVYDGKDAEGRPVVDRPAVEGNTRTAVLAYLESAPIVLAARSFEQDEFAPADRDVPLNFRTDGTWVWAGAVSHYLHKHGVAPEAELVQHIVSRGFRVGTVDDAAQDAAIKVITGG